MSGHVNQKPWFVSIYLPIVCYANLRCFTYLLTGRVDIQRFLPGRWQHFFFFFIKYHSKAPENPFCFYLKPLFRRHFRELHPIIPVDGEYNNNTILWETYNNNKDRYCYCTFLEFSTRWPVLYAHVKFTIGQS